MKKTLMFAAAAAFMMTGLAATEATAGGFTNKCKACHKVDKDSVGPAFKKIQAHYGTADALAKAWEEGFPVSARKVAQAEPKFMKQVRIMTPQYKRLIKGSVDAGKFTYKQLADEVFSK